MSRRVRRRVGRSRSRFESGFGSAKESGGLITRVNAISVASQFFNDPFVYLKAMTRQRFVPPMPSHAPGASSQRKTRRNDLKNSGSPHNDRIDGLKCQLKQPVKEGKRRIECSAFARMTRNSLH